MNKILMLISLSFIALACSEYDDSAIKEDIGDLKNRMTAIESLCAKLNTNITSMQSIVQELEDDAYLTNVEPVMEENVIVGYRLTYNTGTTVDLYHGQDNTHNGQDGIDGKDGQDGKNGTDGKDGVDGQDGQNGVDGIDGIDGQDGTNGQNGKKGPVGDDGTDGLCPSISIKMQNGKYYWTVNGVLVKDDNGNLIPAVGNNGTQGEAAVIPKLRINTITRQWEVSYDAGGTWNELGAADNVADDTFFKTIDNSNSAYLLVKLHDDTELKIIKKVSISISTSENSVLINANQSKELSYTLSGEFANAKIETVVSVKGWKSMVVPTDTKTGKIILTASDSLSAGELLIIAYDGSQSTAMHKVAFQSEANLPTLLTALTSHISTYTVYNGGSILTTGGVDIIEQGICYSTSPAPTVDNMKIVDTKGQRSFSLKIKGLSKNSSYYVRAYAVNAIGVAYGNEVSFTTLASYDGLPSNEEGYWKDYAATNFNSGTGTKTDPYIISTAEELAKLSNDVNNGTSYRGQYFELNSEIDLSEKEFTPIGTLNGQFEGNFDGNGHRIIGLYINQPSANYIALIGFANGGAVIKNVGVLGYIRGASGVGGLVGENKNNSVVTSCYFIGEVCGTQSVGGIVGHNYQSGRVENCYNKGHIYIDSGTSEGVGGIVGSNRSSCVVTNCYNLGEISGKSSGSVVGTNDGSLSSSCFLSGSADFGIGKITSDDNDKAKRMSDAELKSAEAVTILNGTQFPSPWKADNATPVNNGYPIFVWQ